MSKHEVESTSLSINNDSAVIKLEPEQADLPKSHHNSYD
jgi:hypothetical protein